MTDKVKTVFFVLRSNIIIILNRFFGTKVYAHPLSMIMWGVSLITNQSTIRIGKKSCVRKNAEIHSCGKGIVIGNMCFINRNTMLVSHDYIHIGDGTTIGPNTSIYDHDHDGKGSFISRGIDIGRNVWIGANVVILKGVTIGDNAVLAAGAVVNCDVPSMCVYGGNPAKLLKKLE